MSAPILSPRSLRSLFLRSLTPSLLPPRSEEGQYDVGCRDVMVVSQVGEGDP